MNRSRLKTWLAIGGLLGLIGVGLFAVRVTVSLVQYFQAAAEPVSPLNLVPELPPGTPVALSWLPDAADTGREMEPWVRRQIGATYLRAWDQLNLSWARDEPYGLRTYFVGPALATLNAVLTEATTDGLQVSQRNARHCLELHFYSADGSIIAFTDQCLTLDMAVFADDQPLLVEQETAVLDVVMFLEDGNWRVRHWVRRSAEAQPLP